MGAKRWIWTARMNGLCSRKKFWPFRPRTVICEAGLATVAIREQPRKADAAFAPG